MMPEAHSATSASLYNATKLRWLYRRAKMLYTLTRMTCRFDTIQREILGDIHGDAEIVVSRQHSLLAYSVEKLP